jgi:hypothetical protein
MEDKLTNPRTRLQLHKQTCTICAADMPFPESQRWKSLEADGGDCSSYRDGERPAAGMDDST